MSEEKKVKIQIRLSQDLYKTIFEHATKMEQPVATSALQFLKRGVEDYAISSKSDSYQIAENDVPLFFKRLLKYSLRTQICLEELIMNLNPAQGMSLIKDANEAAAVKAKSILEG